MVNMSFANPTTIYYEGGVRLKPVFSFSHKNALNGETCKKFSLVGLTRAKTREYLFTHNFY